jgi:hypothetical protein
VLSVHFPLQKEARPDDAADRDSLALSTASDAKNALIFLLKRIGSCCDSSEDFSKSKEVKLMLYFDEAHLLATRKVAKDPDGKDMYDVLCSCFNSFLSCPIFVIFLSTSSSLSQMAPHRSLARSARARENADALQAPITETPFDCSPELPITPENLELEDLSQIKFLALFGRPMCVWHHIHVMALV